MVIFSFFLINIYKVAFFTIKELSHINWDFLIILYCNSYLKKVKSLSCVVSDSLPPHGL